MLQVMRKGKDVTITAFSKMVGFSLEAAEILAKEGIDVEVINLRSIKPLDRDTIAESVRKTHRIVNVEEGWPQSGVGSEVAAVVMEDAFDALDAPFARVAGAEVPTPYAANLEAQVFPSVSAWLCSSAASAGKVIRPVASHAIASIDMRLGPRWG